MTALAFKVTCYDFVQAAAPYLHIPDDEHYKQTLDLIESFLEEAEDSLDDPINAVIEMLSRAVETYENLDSELVSYEARAIDQPSDLATLRVIMDQYHLGTADLPEIGSKSMVSRVLSGDRNLNKKHISALCRRFNISPSLFF